jgi:hypothetical protein
MSCTECLVCWIVFEEFKWSSVWGSLEVGILDLCGPKSVSPTNFCCRLKISNLIEICSVDSKMKHRNGQTWPHHSAFVMRRIQREKQRADRDKWHHYVNVTYCISLVLFGRKKVHKSTFKQAAERKLNRTCDIIVGFDQIQTRCICILTDYHNNSAHIFQRLVYFNFASVLLHFLLI